MFALKWVHRKKPDPIEVHDDVELRVSNGFTRSKNIIPLSPYEPYDRVALKEIIDEIDSKYFSSTIDCAEYEMQYHLAKSFRDPNAINARLDALEKQSDAVCRQLSNLILEKQPHYQRELKNVLLLQDVNGSAYEECIEARRSLEILLRSLVEPRAIVIRNRRRRLRLKRILETLESIRDLKTSVTSLNKLVERHKFCEAIALYRQSTQTTEDFKPYAFVDSLQQSLRTANLKIDNALDSALAQSCESFDPDEYALLQRAYERLGSTMTTVAQLQVHYTTRIHERAAAVVAQFCGTPLMEEMKNIVEYERLFGNLKPSNLVVVLSKLLLSLWQILVCYHRTALWHEAASSKEENDAATETNDGDAIHSPGLVRQWHGYMASKLGLNRGRVWMDVVSRVRPLLACIARNAKQLSFEEIVATLNMVNRLVRVGKEFAGHMSFDLLEVLKNSIRGFFSEFHRRHMERLRLFLEQETWERVPVRPAFSLRDLHEFRVLNDLLAANEDDDSAPSDMTESGRNNLKNEKLFQEPYDCHFFEIDLEAPKVDQKISDGAEQSPLDEIGANKATADGDRDMLPATGPILANTTIEVFRLFCRYLQMMRLLRPIASEVMHSIGQIFDYYLYVVYSLFGRSFSTKQDAAQLPEHLRESLNRISTRLIAPAGHPSIDSGIRFEVPDCVLNPFNSVEIGVGFEALRSTDTIITHIRCHLVGVESLVYLASVLGKDLLPHLRECLPESKRGLLDTFRDQSLVTTSEVQEATARHLASRVLPSLLLLVCAGSASAKDSTEPQHLLRHLITSNSGWTSKTFASGPSAYTQSLNTAVTRFAAALKAVALPMGPAALRALWMGAMTWIADEMLEGLAGIHECSEEGRSQMLLDVQSTALLCETESGIRPFVKLNLLMDYIQAYYVPTRDFANWLETGGVHRYSQRQALGLAACLSRGDKSARQRLVATVTTVYARLGHLPSSASIMSANPAPTLET